MRWLLLIAGLLLAGCTGSSGNECDAETPCAFGSTCIDGFCVEAQCATSDQCPMEHYCTDSRQCTPGCEGDGDCLPGYQCDLDEATCVEAACEDSHVDCGFRQYCNTATGECYDAGGDFCKPCEPDNDDCGAGNICWAGYCAVNCDGDRECPSGFQCAPFTDGTGNVVTYQCITYCWLYDDYEDDAFLQAPDVKGALPLQPEPGTDPRELLGTPEAP